MAYAVGAEYHNAIQGGVRPASEKYSFYCFQDARINGTGQEFEVRWKSGEITWVNEEILKLGE